MPLRKTFRAALLLLLATVPTLPQSRFGNEHGGMFRGFTKSPNEHIMNEFPGVPEVRAVRGLILDTTGEALPGALFEIRTEDPTSKVRGAVAKSDGRFQLRSLPDGTYMFKVTMRSFQSVYGRIRVSHRAPCGNALKFELHPGV